MALDSNFLFGIHSVTFCELNTGEIVAGGKVQPGSFSINSTQEQVSLTGGQGGFPLDVQPGEASGEVSFALKQLNRGTMEYVFGADYSFTAASTTGTVKDLRNSSGDSVVDATTGIASVALVASEEADLAGGLYVIKAASATTVNVFAATDIDFNKGATKAYADQELSKINDSPLSITSGGSTAITNFGISLEGGSGTIAMTEGDTAVFHVYPAHGGVHDYKVGLAGLTAKKVAIYAVSKTLAQGGYNAVYVPNVLFSGGEISFNENEHSVPELTGTLQLGTHPTTGEKLAYWYTSVNGG